MIYSNFKPIELTGKNALDYRIKASVDVTEKRFLRPSVTRTRCIDMPYGQSPFFSDDGEYTESGEVQKLIRAFEASVKSDVWEYMK